VLLWICRYSDIAMCPATQKPIALVLIATLATVASVGEGLHWLPGMAHSIEMPDGSLRCIGCLPLQTEALPLHEGFGVQRSQDEWPPVLDEDGCPICRACSGNQSLASAVHVILTMPLVHELPAGVLCQVNFETTHSFQARAPPLV